MRIATGDAAVLLRMLLVAVTVLSLLFPAIDHHLAERVPWHQHLTPTGASVAVPHQHAHDHEHHHVINGPLVLTTGAPVPLAATVAASGVAPAAPGETLVGAGRAPVLTATIPVLPHSDGLPLLLPNRASAVHSAHTIAPDLPPPIFSF